MADKSVRRDIHKAIAAQQDPTEDDPLNNPNSPLGALGGLAGGLAGGAIGARIGGFSRKALRKAQGEEDFAIERSLRHPGSREFLNDAEAAMENTRSAYNKGSVGRFVGTGAGSAGGVLGGNAYANGRFDNKKRRKK